mgnify:CR=1 FL=1
MVGYRSTYDAGKTLGKSRFTQNDTINGDNMTEQHTGNDENLPNFSNVLLNELLKATATIESLYKAISILDAGLANELLENAVSKLDLSIRNIAAEFSLGMYNALLESETPIVKKGTKEHKKRILKSTKKLTEIKEEPIPENDLDDVVPENQETYRRSGPISLGMLR